MPIAPAFMRSAPPTFPGMPSIHSKPPMPLPPAMLASFFKRTPAPAVISPRVPTVTSENAPPRRVDDRAADAAIAD